MRILGFDTATRATVVAVCDLGAAELTLELRDDPALGARPRHTTRLMPLIAELLARTSSSWGEIDRIAVGVGPGTFTGLRIGIATANALGRANEIPLVGISTLQSLALNGARVGAGDGADTVLAAIDARRGEAFAAAWRVLEGDLREQLLAPRATPPGELARLLPALGSRVLALGDGAVEFRSQLEQSGASVPGDDSELHRVTAINHCVLAASRPASADQEIRPEYLRLPDAEITRRATGSP